MTLQLLCATSTVAVYYDSHNNWLFLDWEGELTLRSIRRDSLEIARCFLGKNYPRVLNSNAHLTEVAWEVSAWLTHNLFHFLHLVGVEQFAWVHAAGLRGRDMAEDTAQGFPRGLELALFADIEQAVTWLQQTSANYCSSTALPRSAEKEARLQQLVQDFSTHMQQLALAA